MQLNEHLARVIARSQKFFAATEPGHLLTGVHWPVARPPIPPLFEFDLDTQLERWLDYQLAAARVEWAAKTGLDDDSLPAICPSFGIAEHSAWLGMDVLFQETTCLPIPGVQSPEDLEKITLNPADKWFNYMKKAYAYLKTRQDGTFFLAVRGTMMPMDIANALRGDEIFTDFFLEPEFAHRLMRFLTDAIQWYYPHLLRWADNLDGGHIFRLGGGWIPDRCLGHTSNDLAMLCSNEIYEKFGFPYEAEICQKFDRVFYHVHNEKIHYVPKLAQLPNLALLEVSHDPKTPEPIDELPKIYAMTGKANLMLHATSEQVRQHLGELQARNVFLNVTCTDRADAVELIGRVRSQSK
jgi:hypothetical protein